MQVRLHDEERKMNQSTDSFIVHCDDFFCLFLVIGGGGHLFK